MEEAKFTRNHILFLHVKNIFRMCHEISIRRNMICNFSFQTDYVTNLDFMSQHYIFSDANIIPNNVSIAAETVHVGIESTLLELRFFYIP